jgi:hypothetical protein
MKRSILIFISSFFIANISAQSFRQWNPFYDLEKTGYYYIFGNHVNIRSEPDKSAATVGQLNIGDSIQILKIEDTKNFTMKNLEYPWVQIKGMINGSLKTGYVWGGFIAFYRHVYLHDSKKKYQVYMGPSHFNPQENKLFGEVKLCNDTSVIDKSSFELYFKPGWPTYLTEGVFDYDFTKTALYSYRTISKIINVHVNGESCGPYSEIYVLIEDKKIIFSGSQRGSYSGGGYAEGNEFVFPWDKGGMKEKIFEYYSYFETKDESGLPIKDTTYLINTYSKIKEEFVLDKNK